MSTKPVPRSRLNITYRTKIEGTPKKAKLPMRFLVLGDFTGGNETPLGEREVQSILPGMQLKSFMSELEVTAPIDDPELKQKVKGAVVGKVTARFKKPPLKANPTATPPVVADTKATLLVTGTVTVTGARNDNGLGDFTGESIRVSGEVKDVALKDGKLDVDKLKAQKLKVPMRFKVRGDLEKGGMTGAVDGEVTLDVGAARDAQGDDVLDCDVSGDVEVELTIPLFDLTHFRPLHIAGSVPEIRRLVTLRRIVLELRGYISGNPALSKLLKEKLASAELKALQADLKTRYRQLLIEPGPKPATAAPADVPADAKLLVESLLTALGMKAGDWKQKALISSAADAPPGAAPPGAAQPGAQPGAAPPGATQPTTTAPALTNLKFYDHELDFPYEDRFVNALAVFLVNVDLAQVTEIRDVMQQINELSVELDTRVQARIHRVLHSESFKRLEAHWLSLRDICAEVSSNEVIIDFLDISKEKLRDDLRDHSAYILNSALFRKIYVEEYDRYGGRPFGVMIGLYDFDRLDPDREWLETMSHIAAASHCPFVAAVSPKFFDADTWADLERKDDLETLLSMPQFGKWDAFRETDHAAYIGLTLPKFMLRAPYDQDSGKSKFVDFVEQIDGPDDYLWGNAAVLFARNMVRSFQDSGWCQHIVGPRGGGLIRGLPVHMMLHHGHMELQPPVEIAIPDYRELQFANTGFMSLIHCKGTADSTFFSVRSIKKALEFEEDLATKNADLVCNLSYTLSITRLAHYVKRMVRDYIGSTADAPYIQAMLESWLIGYVTTAVNPDDLTLLYYPFKAMSVVVTPKPGPFGWYNCTVSVLPHIQFQGMDVELRLEAALGGA